MVGSDCLIRVIKLTKSTDYAALSVGLGHVFLILTRVIFAILLNLSHFELYTTLLFHSVK